MNAWTTQHSVEHIVAHRLALVERAVPLRLELLKRICKDAFSVAGTVQETCSSELLGGADFLRVVAFWSIRSVGLLR